MWMIVTHDLADYLRALAVCTIRGEAHITHADENSAMNGFQAVAHIGQSSPDDDTHRVVDVGPPHFVLDIYRDEIR